LIFVLDVVQPRFIFINENDLCLEYLRTNAASETIQDWPIMFVLSLDSNFLTAPTHPGGNRSKEVDQPLETGRGQGWRILRLPCGGATWWRDFQSDGFCAIEIETVCLLV